MKRSHMLFAMGALLVACAVARAASTTRPAANPASTKPAGTVIVPSASGIASNAPAAAHPGPSAATTHPTLPAAIATPAPTEDLLLDPARKALEDGKLPAFAKRVSVSIGEKLDNLDQVNFDDLTRLAAYREFATYFGRVNNPDAKQVQTLDWLLKQPRLLRTLMMAVTDADPPDGVLNVLTFLHEDMKDNLANYPELTTAFCVVWDIESVERDGEKANVESARIVRLFHYYTNAGSLLRYDMQDLPWQLGVYVVDNHVSETEIQWADKRYGHYGNGLGKTYFDVPYDEDAFYVGKRKKIDDHEYTLPNLVLFGGVCIDQAYYATHVSRSLGVPAAICSGQGGGGDVSHAWVGFLENIAGRVRWNFDEGRYIQDLYWNGSVTDPQTRDTLTDADVEVLAELQNSKPADRLSSIALWKVRALSRPDSLAALYTKAIDLSPGNRAPWIDLAELGKARKLSPEQMNEVMAVVQKFALKKYESFAFDICMRLSGGQGNAEQLVSLDKAALLFKDRPDLLADIRVRQAKILRDEKKPADALQAYGDVLTHHLDAGPIIIQAMAQVDEMLHSEDMPRLLGIYKQVFNRMPKPIASSYMRGTPYFVIGNNYADAMERAGDKNGAKSLRNRLEGMIPKGPQTN